MTPLLAVDPPSGDVTGATDATALVAAHDALPKSGGRLVLQPGRYYLDRNLPVTKPVHIEGAGALSTSLSAGGAFAGRVVTLAAIGAAMSGLTVNGDNGTSRANGVLVAAARVCLSQLIVSGCAEGLTFDGGTGQAHAAQVSDVKAVNCTGYGVNITGNGAYDQQFSNLWVGNCGTFASMIVGSDDCCFSNLHVWGAPGTADGIRVRANHTRISNAYVETNGGNGLDGYGRADLLVSNSQIWANGVGRAAGGVNLSDMRHVGLSNSTIHNNNGPGINGSGASTLVTVTGSRFYDDRATKTQTRPIITSGASDQWVVTGNIMRAADHLAGRMMLAGAGNVVTGNLE